MKSISLLFRYTRIAAVVAGCVASVIATEASAQCASGCCETDNYCDAGYDFDAASCDGCSGNFSENYVSLFGGFLSLEDQTATGLNRRLDNDFDDGFAFGAAIGRRFGNNWRAEAEFAFRDNNIDEILFLGNDVLESGDTQSYSGMFNLLKDFQIGNSRFRPYIGGGIGFAFVDSNLQYNALPARLNGDDSGFAYQAMLGCSADVTDKIEFFVEYRYFAVDSPQLNRFGGSPLDAAGTGPIDVILDSEYETHGVNFGLRIAGW